MNAVAKIEVMDWSRFTAEEWFKQYGAYIQTCRMKSGNEPDGLRVNQIYWLICENNKGVAPRKDQIICKISDLEADEVRKWIVDFNKMTTVCDSAKIAVKLFIEKNVRGMSLRQMAAEFSLGRTSLDGMLYAGQFYLAGHDKRLKID
ncbi:hypothetical protein BEN74_04080 [Acinetobacter sp. WCHAc010034]|uniref:hypothetical protein n=1 Tax=Acinetobacter sp. WCHAc010034 TaxID=1879049 RepID=UPI00083A2C54|nr:hypothetical protein [Acinetobacter sp. WCHAc010034]AYA02126.1 hypothetical protein BEN74_04080 [Acinetobacter sp. WCHAc010034]